MNCTRVKWVIVLSLALNLLLLGVVFGQWSHRLFRPSPFEREWKEGPSAVLSPQRREEFTEAIKRMREESRPIRKEIRKLREETAQLLSAETFDEAAYQAKIDQMHALHGKQMQKMADAAKELARKWTPKERAALAKLMRRPPAHPRPDAGEDPPPPPSEEGLPRRE